MSVIAAGHDDAIRAIAQQVIDRIGVPHDSFEIAAQIEVSGVRDIDARDRYGCSDVFDLARRAYALFERGELHCVIEADDRLPRVRHVVSFLRDYARGLVFALPMLLQGVTLLLTGYGLWGGSRLDIRTGTAIALGFVASYIATGGLTQAIVRRGLFYRYQDEGVLARWSVLRMWAGSLRAVLLLIVPALLFNFLLRSFPWDMLGIAVLYYTALSLLWLNWSLVYLVDRSALFVVALIVALGVVVVCGEALHWPLIAANMAGLVVANALTFAVGWSGLARWARTGRGTPSVNPPRLAVIVYGTARVFLYGLFYSTFVFADRILAWTTDRGREDFPPYSFWLSARYELAMDFALVVVVILGGVVEHATRRFSESIVPAQKMRGGAEVDPFCRSFERQNDRHTLLLAASSIFAVLIAFAVFIAARSLPHATLHQNLMAVTTTRVFYVAAVSYAIFMIGVQNILVLLTLSRADVAVRIVGAALLVNVVVGFTLSRSLHYAAAIVGLFCGAVTLLVLSRKRLRAVLRELDYFYYAAY